MTTPTLNTLMILTRDAYRALEADYSDDNVTAVYAALAAAYAEHGLDADVAESSVDWFEAGPLLLAESLADALTRLPVANDTPAHDEPCDCADFENCSSCHAWAVDMLAKGFSPWSGKFIGPGDDIAPIPPKWY